jgi:hypothetical protein
MDLNAYETAQITNISHVSCKNLFKKIRLYIFNNLLEENFSKGIFELDESYFGARRVRGKRGRGAYLSFVPCHIYLLILTYSITFLEIKICYKSSEFFRALSSVRCISLFYLFGLTLD